MSAEATVLLVLILGWGVYREVRFLLWFSACQRKDKHGRELKGIYHG